MATGRLANLTCLVTGGAAGIGRACALAYAREGASVAIVDVAARDALETIEEIRDLGGQCTFVEGDVSSSAVCADAVAHVVAEYGHLDVIHANAGVELCAPIIETTDEDWRRVIGTNLDGVFFVCREGLRLMIDQRSGGVITVTSSPLAIATGRDIAAYTAAKGGASSLVRAFSLEAAPFGIRANAIMPGTTDTPMIRREVNASSDPEQMLSRWAESVPLGRLALPDDIARVAVFLASDDARFVTGASVAVDGGQLATFNTGPVYGYTQ